MGAQIFMPQYLVVNYAAFYVPWLTKGTMKVLAAIFRVKETLVIDLSHVTLTSRSKI